MRILHINKFHYLRGGAERYLLDVCTLSERAGAEVAVFRSRHPDNLPSPWERYDAPFVQTEGISLSRQGLRTATSLLYSFPARRRLSELLDAFRPDVVHLHNIYHQLSTSVLDALREHDVPAVMTIHDFGIVAPNHSLFHDGAVCTCGVDQPFHVVCHRAVKNSYLASGLAATDRWVTRGRRVYERTVSRFLVPSRFAIGILARAGLCGQVLHFPFFADTESYSFTGPEGRHGVVFVGRLILEKGPALVLEVARRLPETPFRIVGAGPDEAVILRMARGMQNVTFVGWCQGTELRAELARARLALLPALWYEVFGLVATEAMAAGLPVVATATGGLKELVLDGETGFLVPCGDVDGLVERVSRLVCNPGLADRMGRAARALAEADYSPARHMERLFGIYEDVAKRR